MVHYQYWYSNILFVPIFGTSQHLSVHYRDTIVYTIATDIGTLLVPLWYTIVNYLYWYRHIIGKLSKHYWYTFSSVFWTLFATDTAYYHRTDIGYIIDISISMTSSVLMSVHYRVPYRGIADIGTLSVTSLPYIIGYWLSVLRWVHYCHWYRYIISPHYWFTIGTLSVQLSEHYQYTIDSNYRYTISTLSRYTICTWNQVHYRYGY